MNARPILFSGPMIRSLLDGRKSQTRRVVKPLSKRHPIVNLAEHGESGRGYSGRFNDPESWGFPYAEDGADMPLAWWPELCPYGKRGDLLIVRETWQYADWTEDGYPFIGYRADETRRLVERGIPEDWGERLSDIWSGLSVSENYAVDGRAADRRWRPAIHMPRWASRLTLRITDVRAQRLQDISEEDAEAEGVTTWAHEACARGNPLGLTAAGYYEILWETINGEGAWQANPWVWALTFDVIRENVGKVLDMEASK